MREGYYTDAYFNHTRETLLRGRPPAAGRDAGLPAQPAMLGGIDEAIAVLKLCSDDWDALTVHALHDGDRIEPWETVMTIEGDYTLFAHLETVYLGVLTRRTLITTNTARVVEAANGKPIIFMPARHDHHRVQTGDGYAAYVAGAMIGAEIGVTSDAQASWWGGRGVGTVPHALIASYGGNTVLAATKFAEWAPRRHEHRRPRRLRERLGAHRARGRARARAAALGRAARHLRPARRPLALGARWATSTRAASTSGSCARCATRWTRTASSGCGSSRPAGSPSTRSRTSSERASRSTPTASARR